MIRVLIVEDSPSIQEFLTYILSADPDLKVVGTAENGEEAVEATVRLKPDVITMDIHMPKMDGFEATHRIMEIQKGLTWESIKWAFMNPMATLWQPLTMLSHMAVYQVCGLNPWGHHLANVLLHAFNAGLVFALL